MVEVSLKLEGLKELESQLLALKGKTGQKALRSALNKASTPIVKAAKQAAPIAKGPRVKYSGKGKGRAAKIIEPGALKKSVRKSSGRIKAGLDKSLAALIKIRAGSEDAYYVHMVHGGTTSRATKKGANRGDVQPRPFLKQAFDGGYQSLLSEFKRILKQNIEKVSSKNAK